MPRLPPEPAPGKPLSASWGRLMARYVRAITLQSSPKLLVRRTANGTTAIPRIKATRNQDAASEPCDAFSIVLTPNTPPAYLVTLVPGTINQAVPSNILTPIAYNSTTDRYVKLKCTTDGYALTGVTVALEGTVTPPIGTAQNAGPTSFEVLIGVISQGVVTQVWSDCNMTATLTLALIESKVSPVPGTSPYNFYYTWVVTGH